MRSTARQVHYILKFFKKEKIFFLIFSMFLVSILELIGISLVIPFVTSIIEPEYIDGRLLKYLENYIDISKKSSFSGILILLILMFYLLKNIFVIFVISKQWKYSMNIITLIRVEFFKRYLNSRYIDFIKKDYSEQVSNIMNVSATFGATFIVNLLIFISEFLIVFSIITLLFIFNFKLTFFLIVIFLIIISIYYKFISKKLKRAGLKKVESDEKILSHTKLSFNNIKELKLFNKIDYFLELFSKNAKESEISNYFYQVSAQYPRIGMEIFAILGICVLTLSMNFLNYKSIEIVTTLAFYGVSIFRILPSANKLMFSFQSVRFAKESLNIIYKELKNNEVSESKVILGKKINFLNEISIENLTFGYEEKSLIFKKLNFNIKKGSFVAIKGKSGSGKTTLIDILMGLIMPLSGQIKVDDNNIYNDLYQWRDRCGYVPQNISLMHDTIASNVAFGVAKKDINLEKIKSSLKIAGLKNFVNSLQEKENTLIGDNGLTMSGGQRQRLAIARAIYRDPDIIFFDEATSALDKEMEKEVINSINSLKGKITIILISHNKELYKNCDKIIDLDQGLINE